MAYAVIAPTGEHARLTALRGASDVAVSLIEGNDPLDERSRVVHAVQKLVADGVAPHDIAIISRKNDTADLFARELEAIGVPALRAGDISLTSRPLVRSFLALLTYVADPLRLDALREALLAPWWDCGLADVSRLLRTTYDSELAAGISAQFPVVHDVLIDLIEKARGQTPIEAVSYILTTSGARDYFLTHPDHIDDIALVRQIFMHIEELSLRADATSFAAVMATFATAQEHEMSPVKSSATEREGMVTVITAHKAKGMEFAHVFIPDLTENGWEKGGKPAMIPSPFENKQTLDDVRRLFYVALTRAKDHAYLSYACENKDGRERKVSTLLPAGLPSFETASSPLPVLHETVTAPELVCRLSKQFLTEDGLSPSALSEYLESPAKFFACRVLRIKEPPQGPAVLGSAVHKAIACLLEGKTPEESHASLDQVFTRSLLPRDPVFSVLRAQAHTDFDSFIPEAASLGTPLFIEKAFRTTIDIDGTKTILQGKIDAVFETPQGITIVDFKTGSSLSPKNEDYIRQLMLYVELLRTNGHETKETMLLGISKDGIKRVPIAITPEACAKAREEFEAVARELLRGNWRKGAPSSYDAVLALIGATAD